MHFINDIHNTHVPPQHMDYDEPCVVLIYANWCPHCQVMEPEWDEATKEMEENVKVMKIESNDLPQYQHMLNAHKAHSNGYPTIYAFTHGGEEPQYYGGERKKAGFISWVKNLFPMTKKKATKKKATKKKATKKKGTKKKGGFLKQEQKKNKKQKKQKKGKGDRSRSKSVF